MNALERDPHYAHALLVAQQESSLDGILVVDAEGMIVSYNGRFADLWGLPSEILAARSDQRALTYILGQLKDPEPFLARVRDYYENRWKRGRDEIELNDGRTFERYTAPVFGPRGRYYGRVWHFRDVTMHRTVLAERRENETRYRELFEAESDPVFMIDAQTRRIEDANRAALAKFGYAKEELRNLRIESLDAESRMARMLLRLYWRRGRWPARVVRELRDKEGRRFPAEITSSRFELDGRVKLIGMVRDVTERRRAEEFERLREREKLQRELVATVSHELRGPIASIHGFAETLAAGAADDPKTRAEFIKTILRQSERLGRLVEDLLTLSVLENGRRKPRLEEIDAGRLLSDLMAGMAPMIKKRRLKLRAGATPGLTVKADPGQLTQVLQNLLDNAIKFSPPRGTIRVEACRLDSAVLFLVADQGPGIPADQLQRVFEPFQRAESAQKVPGTGLGLAIVKQVVSGHGGRVWAENRPGGGAVFQFTIPAEPARPLPNPN